MPNIRIVYDNAANRATITSSSVVSSLPAANLLSDIKSMVCRGTGTALTLTLTWTTPEEIDCTAFAFTNASVNAIISVEGYTEIGDTIPVYNKSNLASLGSVTDVKGVNNLAYGSGVYATHWLDSTITVRKLVITLFDPSNAQGYIEAGRLIVGKYWQPSFGVEQEGTSLTMVDSSTQFRTEAGDMHITVKPRYRKQTLSMPSLNKADQKKMWTILWNNGIVKPLFLSLHPNNSDKELEQSHVLYGRLSSSPSMQTPYFSYQSATLDIEEI